MPRSSQCNISIDREGGGKGGGADLKEPSDTSLTRPSRIAAAPANQLINTGLTLCRCFQDDRMGTEPPIFPMTVSRPAAEVDTGATRYQDPRG